MIFFLHIPKTAGTTFYDVVNRNYIQLLKPKIEESPLKYLYDNLKRKKSAIRLPGGYDTAPLTLRIIENLTFDILKNIDFIGGHVGYGFHENYAGKIDYISFIRHPRERLISDYKEHCKKGRFFYNILRDNDFEFNSYLKALKANKLDNILTRQLAGPFDFFLKERIFVDDELLEKAKLNCKSILFFDIAHFDEALRYLNFHFSWKKINYQIKNQSNSVNTEFKVDENLLNEIIKYDLEIYKIIKPLRFKKKSIFK